MPLKISKTKTMGIVKPDLKMNWIESMNHNKNISDMEKKLENMIMIK